MTRRSEDKRRELALSKLIGKAEEIDADAIVDLGYETESITPVEEPGLQLTRMLATGIAVKLACEA
jgi:uncharacterized protein YbjQ (UPF0145 family)